MAAEWRPAARQAMWQAAIQEATEDNHGLVPAFNYRWEHVTAVVTLAVKLAHLTGADGEVVEAAAWLHDVTKQDGEAHARTGADFARAFLAQTDFPPKKIEPVAQAIADHLGLWREEPLSNLESMVLWDADKLSKLGLTAAIHWAGMALSGGKPVTSIDLIARAQHAEWQSKTVASLHTGPARRAAESRLRAFIQLWKDLEIELSAGDLT